MTTVEELPCVRTQDPPQCDIVNKILEVKSLTSHDKVWQFVEEQEREQLSPTDVSHMTFPDDLQDATPLCDVEVLPADEQPPSSKAHASDRQKGSTRQKASCKRKHRREHPECDDDDPLLLFRRSQKALRKEARHVNMKEVLCRSLSGVSDVTNDGSDLLSPVTGLQSFSTWSPSLATSITNRFLSNVQQQKKQAFNRLLQKEITNSQLSISRLTTENGESDDGFPELVIGDDTAIMEPPKMENDTFPAEISVTPSQLDTFLISNTTSRSFVELDEEEEQAQSEALMHKHELWRLRTKHFREKLFAEESVSQTKLEDCHQVSRSQALQSTTTATTTTTTTTTNTSVSTMPLSTVDVDGTAEGLIMSQRRIIHRSRGTTFRLSVDHIDMIRRANNFDNTSSQRVVVFESKSSQQSKCISSQSKQSVP